MRPNETLLDKSGPVLHCLLKQHDETKQIFTHTGLGLTGQKKITRDYRKYRMYLKFQTEHFLNFTTLALNLATDEVLAWFTSTITMCFSSSLCNKFCSPHPFVYLDESHHFLHMQHSKTLFSNCFIQHQLMYSLLMDH